MTSTVKLSVSVWNVIVKVTGVNAATKVVSHEVVDFKKNCKMKGCQSEPLPESMLLSEVDYEIHEYAAQKGWI